MDCGPGSIIRHHFLFDIDTNLGIGNYCHGPARILHIPHLLHVAALVGPLYQKNYRHSVAAAISNLAFAKDPPVPCLEPLGAWLLAAVQIRDVEEEEACQGLTVGDVPKIRQLRPHIPWAIKIKLAPKIRRRKNLEFGGCEGRRKYNRNYDFLQHLFFFFL